MDLQLDLASPLPSGQGYTSRSLNPHFHSSPGYTQPLSPAPWAPVSTSNTQFTTKTTAAIRGAREKPQAYGVTQEAWEVCPHTLAQPSGIPVIDGKGAALGPGLGSLPPAPHGCAPSLAGPPLARPFHWSPWVAAPWLRDTHETLTLTFALANTPLVVTLVASSLQTLTMDLPSLQAAWSTGSRAREGGQKA